MTNPEFSFDAKHIKDDLFQINIHAKNLPLDFLGTGFDIVIDGTNWTYDYYTLGEIFIKPLEALSLTTFRNQPEKKLVFGVSMKRGFKIEKNEGILASFYIRFPEERNINIAFKNGVLSTFNGERKNINTAIWKNTSATLEKKNFTNNESEKNKLEESVEKTESNQEQQEFAEDSNASKTLFQLTPLTSFPLAKENFDHVTNFGVVGAIFMIITTLGMIVFIKKKFQCIAKKPTDIEEN